MKSCMHDIPYFFIQTWSRLLKEKKSSQRFLSLSFFYDFTHEKKDRIGKLHS